MFASRRRKSLVLAKFKKPHVRTTSTSRIPRCVVHIAWLWRPEFVWSLLGLLRQCRGRRGLPSSWRPADRPWKRLRPLEDASKKLSQRSQRHTRARAQDCVEAAETAELRPRRLDDESLRHTRTLRNSALAAAYVTRVSRMKKGGASVV